MLNYLETKYIEQLTGLQARPMNPTSQEDIQNRLKPFKLENLSDKNQSVSIPVPDGFGSVDEELEKAYSSYDKDWSLVESLVNADAPSFPTHFYCPIGWSYWFAHHTNPEKSCWKPVAGLPDGKTFILDAETVEVKPGIWHPTCMVAMTENGWMVWRADLAQVAKVSVVPFSTGHNIVGYNIPYDRSYIDVEYHQAATGNRFYDLMSMWIVTNGMSNQQRKVFKSFSGGDSDNPDSDSFGVSVPTWLQKTGTNGLASAYEFYTQKQLDKGVRDGIVDGGLAWVSDNMMEVIRYCALDVLATHELASHLLPAYCKHRPSKVNRYGAVELGSCWIPLSKDRFPDWYERVEAVYQESKVELNELLMSAATEYLELYGENHPAQSDSLDWTAAKTGVNKGLPAWYRKITSAYRAYRKTTADGSLAAKGGLSLSQRWAPLILEMTWGGQPILWDDERGGFYTAKDGLLPHPTERGKAVGNMFLKDFSNLYDSGHIDVPEYVQGLVVSKTQTINWVSTRKRIACIRTESPDGYPVTIPQMSVNGTITGRATDPIWQVTANPKANRIGTELKSMVVPFDGYSFVGADVDSEEAWLAACHGDESLGYSGSTAFSLMTIAGSSKDKTDIHSVVARETGYSRDTTKTRVYGAIYGQGVKGDSDVIMRSDPLLKEEKAKIDSGIFIALFKGSRSEYGYRGGMASHAFTKMEERADVKLPHTPLTGARMSLALAGIKDYKPTRVNWIVQASGVDFRDMLVLLTKSFYQQLGVDGRIILTIHDEIRTMVANEDITKAIYALQLAHLYCRAAFIRAHNLDNIPAGVAWFSNIDVDAICLRKNPLDPQITPTQTALPLGYTVNSQQLMELLVDAK